MTKDSRSVLEVVQDVKRLAFASPSRGNKFKNPHALLGSEVEILRELGVFGLRDPSSGLSADDLFDIAAFTGHLSHITEYRTTVRGRGSAAGIALFGTNRGLRRPGLWTGVIAGADALDLGGVSQIDINAAWLPSLKAAPGVNLASVTGHELTLAHRGRMDDLPARQRDAALLTIAVARLVTAVVSRTPST